MARARGHQSLADIGARRDRHAQTVGRVLMHKAPVRPHQEASFCLVHAVEIARFTMPHAVTDSASRRQKPCRDAIEQRRLARAALANHGQNLARPDIEAHILASKPTAVEFGYATRAEQRLVTGGLRRAQPFQRLGMG